MNKLQYQILRLSNRVKHKELKLCLAGKESQLSFSNFPPISLNQYLALDGTPILAKNISTPLQRLFKTPKTNLLKNILHRQIFKTHLFYRWQSKSPYTKQIVMIPLLLLFWWYPNLLQSFWITVLQLSANPKENQTLSIGSIRFLKKKTTVRISKSKRFAKYLNYPKLCNVQTQRT